VACASSRAERNQYFDRDLHSVLATIQYNSQLAGLAMLFFIYQE
jgi:hypothetical protein